MGDTTRLMIGATRVFVPRPLSCAAHAGSPVHSRAAFYHPPRPQDAERIPDVGRADAQAGRLWCLARPRLAHRPRTHLRRHALLHVPGADAQAALLQQGRPLGPRLRAVRAGDAHPCLRCARHAGTCPIASFQVPRTGAPCEAVGEAVPAPPQRPAPAACSCGLLPRAAPARCSRALLPWALLPRPAPAACSRGLLPRPAPARCSRALLPWALLPRAAPAACSRVRDFGPSQVPHSPRHARVASICSEACCRHQLHSHRRAWP